MKKITKVLLKSFITNILLSAIKIITGIIGASGALIADGLHSLSDTVTDVVAIVGSKLSAKPADSKHPYGHGKIEYITCILIGIAVFMVGISIIYSAIYKEITVPDFITAIIALVVILAKILLSRYLLNKGKQYQSNILIASGSESLSDVISSIVVFVSILVSQLNGIFIYADKIAMIIVGILILRIAFNIFKNNFSSLLGEKVTDKEYISEVRKIIKNEEEIKNIDVLIILKYGSFYQMNCEVSMDGNMILKDAHEILNKIEKNLKRYDQKLKNITIHVNPYKD